MFYVVEGSITFQCREKLRPGKGSFLPHGTSHGYTIRSQSHPPDCGDSPVPRKSGGWGGFVSDLN
jgi:hypothetical protein